MLVARNWASSGLIFVLSSLLELSCVKAEWKVSAQATSPSQQYVYRVEVRKDPVSINTDFTRVVVEDTTRQEQEIVFVTTSLSNIRVCWVSNNSLAIMWEPFLEVDGSEVSYVKRQEGGAFAQIRVKYYRGRQPISCQPSKSRNR